RRHVLVVLDRTDEASWNSLRNVSQVHLLPADQLNTYDVLVSDDVVFTRAALDAFLSRPSGRGAKAVATSTEAELEETK
ncbi:MAG TPA: 50S ribosomal protein L4, partial [Actinotalea sp.]|nr:50S ribosomal protein L4 [Actinotalea sp.]